MAFTRNEIINLKKNLIVLRKKNKYSLQKLEDELKKQNIIISHSNLGNYEITNPEHPLYDRTENMSASNLFALAGFYGVTVDYLLGRAKCSTPKMEQISQVTGLSEKAIYVLRYYKKCYDDSHHDNILPVINFLLEQEMSPSHVALMMTRFDISDPILYNALFEESDLDEENELKIAEPDEDFNDAVYNPSDRKFMNKYKLLCNKHPKGMPIFGELLKYFHTPVIDKDIFLSDKGELDDEKSMDYAKGKYRYCYNQSNIINKMLISDIEKALEYYKSDWQAQNNEDDE